MDSQLSEKVIANLLDQVDELKTPALEGSIGKFSYFPLYAKGLQPTLILAVSGVEWEGNPVQFDAWGAMKATGVCPFGNCFVRIDLHVHNPSACRTITHLADSKWCCFWPIYCHLQLHCQSRWT